MPERTKQTVDSRTWMLFESGGGVSVDLSLYAPPLDRSRPIDAYVVTECEGDFTGSARRAAETVYNVLQQHGSRMDPVVVGYDLQGLPGGRSVTGESGGLAFAIALAKRILDQDPGPVAATGEIKSGHGGGPVGPVKGIIGKLEAAARLLPEKGWVFYPQDNDREIPAELRKALMDKDLSIQPVSSAAQALSLLFDFHGPLPADASQPAKKKNPSRSRILILLLICAAVLLLARIHGWPPFEGRILTEKKDISITEAPLTTSDHKAALSGKTDTPPSPDPSASVPDIHAEIHLSGENGVAADLARLTAEQIAKLLERKEPPDTGITGIGGHVVVVDLVEDPSGKTTGIFTRMTVAVKALTIRKGKTAESFGELFFEVKGEGTAEGLIPEAASALARKIVKAPRPQKEIRREEKTVSGFD